MSAPQIGTEFAGHRIEELIGRGGMGLVYRAVQVRLDRSVALKLILPELASDANFRHRFERECRMAASLDHPNVIPIYEAGEVDGELFVSMRYVDGTDLGQLIALHRALDPRWAIAVVAQVAQALDAAHNHGLIHRDVKPANVLIEGGDARGHVYLTDFGLAKRVSSKTGLTRTQQFVGTIDYTAPEQITGGSIDYRVDVYALGCLMHHVLTGHVPFERETDMAALWAHVNDPPPRLTALAPQLPSALDDVVARAMAKRPEERYLSAGDLAAAAAAALEGRPLPMRERSVARGAAAGDGAAPAIAGSTVVDDVPAAKPTTLEELAYAPPPAAGLADGAPRLPSLPGKRRDTGPARAGIVVAAALAAAGAAFAIGVAAAPQQRPAPLAARAARGDVGLRVPGGWRAPARVAEIPGLRFTQSLARAPRGAPAGEVLVAGHVDAGTPELLPPAFLAKLPTPPRRDDAVLLGVVPAYRYRDLRPRGFARSLTLYVAATTRGVVAISCQAPSAGVGAFLPECERAAASLKLTGATRPFALRPGGQYARTLASAMTTLNRTRVASLAGLRAARSNVTQTQSAQRISAAFGRAASTLAAVPHSPAARDANRALVRALRAAQASWGRFANAAAAGDGAAYAVARVQVRRSDDAVRRALRGLAPLGYRVQAHA